MALGISIAVVGRKGGCGKSSGSMLYGSELLDLGFKAAIIDANSLEASLAEAAQNGEGAILKAVVHEASDNPADLGKKIDAFRQVMDFVIVDTPPASDSMSQMALSAMANADVIVLPMGNDLDEMRSQREFYQGAVIPFIQNKPETKVFVAPNRVELESRVWKMIQKELNTGEAFPGAVVLPPLPMCVPFKEAKGLGLTLLEFPNRSKAVRRLSSQTVAGLKIILASKDIAISEDI